MIIKMNDTRRQKKVASLIKEELSRQMLYIFRDSSECILTVSRVEMTKDLKTAHVYLSCYGKGDTSAFFQQVKEKSGYIRKIIASKIKLKYNPLLIFYLDNTTEIQEKIDKILEQIKKDEINSH